jgi:hypothetical protein
MGKHQLRFVTFSTRRRSFQMITTSSDDFSTSSEKLFASLAWEMKNKQPFESLAHCMAIRCAIVPSATPKALKKVIDLHLRQPMGS